MGALTTNQRRRRADVERLIRLAEPALNLVLAVGERVSRLIEPVDHDYYPPRPSELSPAAPGEPPAARREH